MRGARVVAAAGHPVPRRRARAGDHPAALHRRRVSHRVVRALPLTPQAVQAPRQGAPHDGVRPPRAPADRERRVRAVRGGDLVVVRLALHRLRHRETDRAVHQVGHPLGGRDRVRVRIRGVQRDARTARRRAHRAGVAHGERHRFPRRRGLDLANLLLRSRHEGWRHPERVPADVPAAE